MTRRATRFAAAMAATIRLGQHHVRGKLFFKYISLFLIVVATVLLANAGFEIWFSYQEHKVELVRIQRGQAETAAEKIVRFITEIESQIGWTTQLTWSATALEQRRFDALRLLRQVPAITELAELDGNGREQLRVSRLAIDVVGSMTDFSNDPAFNEAVARKVYYGPVYFRRQSEPYMTLAQAGPRRDAGVTVAEVNLKVIWEVISQIKVGRHGKAYVVDAQGRLIADPDISLVLRNTDMSSLRQVRAGRTGGAGTLEDPVEDLAGRRVLAAYSQVAPLGWTVLVELPLNEAYAPLYASLMRTVGLLAAALLFAAVAGMFLARRMVEPIRTLQIGAARIGSGDLGQRISIKTGDELEALGDQFNRMAAQLQESYGTLEHKVKERTRQLELANAAKSRFLAVASHDLRQPLHALGLFLAQLRIEPDRDERQQLFERIDAAVTAMNELFDALLDISKLDAGVLVLDRTEFPIARLLGRIDATFAGSAREKGLRLRIVPSSAWVQTDFILLERILLNLVANAVRYTERGGIVVGCRHRGASLRIDVCDTGLGIPEDQRQDIFGEFYQIAGEEYGVHRGGLGLGLAIVERLGRLLDHPIDVASHVGRGSRFSVTVPCAEPVLAAPSSPPALSFDPLNGKFVLVIDDDELVRDSMCRVLRGWGCRVMAVASADAALAALPDRDRWPDLIISDYRLADGLTGTTTIEQLRRRAGYAIPAFLMSGDTAPERLRAASAGGHQLLHKPISSMTLRAMISGLLKEPVTAREDRPTAARDAATVNSPGDLAAETNEFS